jgi:hypothetical protein
MLTSNPDGGWPRYLLGAVPALALLAAEGLALGERPRRPLLAALLGVMALLPGAALSLSQGIELGLPDTRELCERWFDVNVPPGATVLLDMPHSSPRLKMTREELVELALRTRAAGSPRAKLYEGMAATHPGGGWRVLRLARTARDLYSTPRRVEQAQADAPTLDAHEGLPALRKAGVAWAVTSSAGATLDRAPELAGYFRDLEERSRLEASFEPVPGRLAGPVLRVYRISYTRR